MTPLVVFILSALGLLLIVVAHGSRHPIKVNPVAYAEAVAERSHKATAGTNAQ